MIAYSIEESVLREACRRSIGDDFDAVLALYRVTKERSVHVVFGKKIGHTMCACATRTNIVALVPMKAYR